jgi:hypothetical protein
MTKDTAIEIRQIDGRIQMFLLTGLVNDSFKIEGENGIPVLNPIDALHLTKNKEYPNNDNFFWVDRNDFEVMWQNAKGEKGKAFSDVAMQVDENSEYDAWLVAEFITNKQSTITNSKIGSTHWFNTIISEHSRIGEFLRENETMVHEASREYHFKEWGKRLYDSSKELLNWAQKSKRLTND